jgi:peptide/nickel transport system permease protein
MHRYLFKRLLMMIPVLLGVTFVVFCLMHLTPGDPARIVLGDLASPEDLARYRLEHGLNDPFLLQYGRYLYHAVCHGDLGNSLLTDTPVATEILGAFPTTLELSTLSMLIAILVGIPFGIISAIKQYSLFDNVVMVLAMVGLAMPVFWLGLLLILVFSVQLHWLPSSGFYGIQYMILPALALSAQSIAMLTRMTRSCMLEVIRQDFIRTVRAKGQKERIVFGRHALKNALIPVITTAGTQFGYLMGGAVLTEVIFSIPGVGRLMISAISNRDYPMVQGGVLFIAVAISIVILLVDLLYALIDPRIKAQYRS